MDDARKPRPWAGLVCTAALGGLVGLIAWSNPQWLLSMCTKEGPAEAAGQVVLLLATLSWAFVRARQGTGARWVAVACAVVFAEELDWGAQLGFTALVDTLGVVNLHNCLGGASYVLFAAPWVVLYGAALRGLRVPAWVPPRLDGVAFGLVVLTASISVVLPSAWEQALDEISELMLYALLAVGGTRLVRL